MFKVTATDSLETQIRLIEMENTSTSSLFRTREENKRGEHNNSRPRRIIALRHEGCNDQEGRVCVQGPSGGWKKEGGHGGGWL